MSFFHHQWPYNPSMPFAAKKSILPGLLLLLLALPAAAYFLLPWKPYLETRLAQMLEAQGLRNVSLSLDRITLNAITFKNLTFGEAAPLTLQDLQIDYTPQELWEGRLRHIGLKGLDIEMRQQGNAWRISGLDSADKDEPKSRAHIPVTLEELSSLPLTTAQLENSRLHIFGEGWQFSTQIKLNWDKHAAPTVTAVATGPAYTMRGLDIVAGDITADAVLNDSKKEWRGKWRMKKMDIKGAQGAPIQLSGDGALIAEAERLQLYGGFGSPDGATRGDFNLDLALNNPDKSRITIANASMPWHQGTIGVSKVTVPLNRKAPTTLTLNVNKVSIATLMQDLTGKQASATGVVTGALPVTLMPDGRIIVEAGKMQAEQPGVISLSPEAIPGDNEQVALVRDILRNFHYELLSIGVSSDKDGNMTIAMGLEGRNPDLYGGKPVKLNVQLSGDVLDLIQQNLMLLTDPKQLLKEGKTKP
jgi:hypothetical protein